MVVQGGEACLPTPPSWLEVSHCTFNRCCWCIQLCKEILSYIMPLTVHGDQARKCSFFSGFPSSLLLLPHPLGPSSFWRLRIKNSTKQGRYELTMHGLGLGQLPGHSGAGLVGQGPQGLEGLQGQSCNWWVRRLVGLEKLKAFNFKVVCFTTKAHWCRNRATLEDWDNINLKNNTNDDWGNYEKQSLPMRIA